MSDTALPCVLLACWGVGVLGCLGACDGCSDQFAVDSRSAD